MICRFRVYVLAIILGISFMPKKVLANHIMGAELTWKAISGDTFLFTAAVYRNCSGIALSNTPFVYFGDCQGYTAGHTVYGTMCCTKDVTPDLGYGCTRCSSQIGRASCRERV